MSFSESDRLRTKSSTSNGNFLTGSSEHVEWGVSFRGEAGASLVITGKIPVMFIEASQYEALLELQRTYVPCEGDNHQWVDDEENTGEQYCSNCLVVKNTE